MNQELLNTLKLYKIGKDNMNDDNIKSIDYFKKVLNNIHNLKKKYDINDMNYTILDNTEQECIKYFKNLNVFKIISENNLEKIRKLTNINFRELNTDGNTILHHCLMIGDVMILKELLKKGGNIDQVNGDGHTLLEYACLRKDPNIINFLIKHGANMKKHLFFRKNTKDLYLNKSDIDLAILLRLIINNCHDNDYHLFSFLENYFSYNELIGLNKYTIRDLSIGLTNMFKNKKSYPSYSKIIIEDLNNFKNSNLKNGLSKIDIILFNLVPFINYPFNISSKIIIKNELKYVIKKNIHKYKKEYKINLVNELFNNYIKNNLFTEDFIGIQVFQLFDKLSEKYDNI
jgi:hypothetical protein